MENKAELFFAPNGKFKILVLADCQDNEKPNLRMIKYINFLLDTEKPECLNAASTKGLWLQGVCQSCDAPPRSKGNCGEGRYSLWKTDSDREVGTFLYVRQRTGAVDYRERALSGTNQRKNLINLIDKEI